MSINILENVQRASGWTNLFGLMEQYRIEAQSEFDARFLDKPRTSDEGRMAWDAYRHMYVSGKFVQAGYSESFVHFLGTAREIPQIITSPEDANMDRWNNALGRGFGVTTPDRTTLALAAENAIRSGLAILDKNSDQREYEGEDLRLSPEDYATLRTAPVNIYTDPEEPFSVLDIPVVQTPEWFFKALGSVYETPGRVPGYPVSPLVLDINGDGAINLVSLDNSTVNFDFWSDGFVERTFAG